jgi:hypothetical protein
MQCCDLLVSDKTTKGHASPAHAASHEATSKRLPSIAVRIVTTVGIVHRYGLRASADKRVPAAHRRVEGWPGSHGDFGVFRKRVVDWLNGNVAIVNVKVGINGLELFGEVDEGSVGGNTRIKVADGELGGSSFSGSNSARQHRGSGWNNGFRSNISVSARQKMARGRGLGLGRRRLRLRLRQRA